MTWYFDPPLQVGETNALLYIRSMHGPGDKSGKICGSGGNNAYNQCPTPVRASSNDDD